MNFKNYFSRSSVVALVIVPMLILVGSQQLQAQGSWKTVSTAGFSAGKAQYSSLALDGSGTPYVAYQDLGNSNKATVMKFDGSNWVTVGAAGFSAGTAQYINLALDGSGTPYVAYQDLGNSSKATVMKFNGSKWVTVGAAGFSAGTGQYIISLALDGSGNPYLAYQDWGSSNKTTVMKFDGSKWDTVGAAGISLGTAQFISLALDGSGNPCVAYQDYTKSFKTTVMKFNGIKWVTVGTAGFSAGTAQYINLAMDGNGTPYVAYQDLGNSSKATVMKFNGSSWVNVGTAGFSAGTAQFTSLALDGSGKPYVAYQDYVNSSKATVMKFNGNKWDTVGTAGFSAGKEQFTSLILNGSGTPYVAYQDWINNFKATVMQFISDQPPVADAGTDQTVIVYETVQLDGSGSSDPNNNPLTYDWSFYSKPAGSSAALSSNTIVNPSFAADVAGNYVVKLVVNNGITDSSPDQVTITALSLKQAIENLIDSVISMNLNHGLTNALTTKLKFITILNSESMNLNHGLTNALTTNFKYVNFLKTGVNMLNSFINQVQALQGKMLTDAQAELLIADAQRIINAINNASNIASLSKQSAQTITQNRVALSYNLEQNYPNPFNPTTQIQFSIPIAGSVTLKIYNSLGQLVNTLVDGNMSAGYHTVNWNATNNFGNKISSGVYFYRITAGSFVQVKKMILMK